MAAARARREAGRWIVEAANETGLASGANPVSFCGGAGGDRTHDPKTASLVLSQLSYSPTKRGTYRRGLGLSKRQQKHREGRV